MPIWWRSVDADHVVEEAAVHAARAPSVDGELGDHRVEVGPRRRLFVNTRSSRSSRNGIHPTWLSENAIFRFGKRSSVPDSSQSAIDM